MLSEQAIQELVDSKEELTKFTTAALAHAVGQVAMRVRDPKTAPNHIAQLVEAVRKVRADLTGDDHQRQMPTMMVNIQLAGAATRPAAIEISPADFDRIEDPASRDAVEEPASRDAVEEPARRDAVEDPPAATAAPSDNPFEQEQPAELQALANAFGSNTESEDLLQHVPMPPAEVEIDSGGV